MTGVALVVLVVTQLPRWPYATQQAVVLPSSLRQAIPAGDPVAITYPYAYGSAAAQPLLWQAQDGFPFRITGGYSFHPTPAGSNAREPNPLSPRGLQDLLASEERVFKRKPIPSGRELVADTRRTLSRYDVRLVIVDRSQSGSGVVMTLFEKALGPPSTSAGSFSLWASRRGALGRRRSVSSR
jgi:hypothetical protein